MSRLRFVPIVVCAITLHSAVLVGQQAPALRTLVSFRDSEFPDGGTSPNGRFVLLATSTNLRMYEVASRQSWNLAEGGAQSLRWSPRGDMVAFARTGDGGSENYVWAMPVDPNTGRARGPAQRVTIGQVGDLISFSVDGRWIAFAGVDTGQAQNLSIVPASGGPERVLARFPNGLGVFEWSADGRTIYAAASAPGTSGLSILKIPVDGGSTEVIRSRDEYLVGMTADRRHLILLPRKNPIAAGDQGTVIDTIGREVGHFPLPVGPVLFDRVLGDSAVVWVTHTDHRRLEVRPVAGGSARQLPLIGQSDDVPLWSPDGNRIAFQVRDGNRTSLAVMNADGTKPRVFRETDVLANAWDGGVWWSPDSRSVGFLSPDRHRLSLLDVVAGTSRTILEDTASVFMAWRWRADGQAIHLASRRSPGFPPGKSIDEVGVNGQHRKLLDLPIPTDLAHGFQMVGDSKVFVRSDSAAFLMPLGTGPARRLTDVPSGTQLYNTVVSNDLRWIAGLLVDPEGTARHQVELFSTETGARTVLDLPFEVDSYRPEFVPSDSSLLVFGHRSGEADRETDIRIYRVPLNGDTPRAFADVGKVLWFGAVSAASASPDGRSVVYSIEAEASTTALVLIDLRGAVPAATSRTPRR
ncbi:MAG: TolB family protein [Longimicrobiales bacterium]